MTKRLIDVKEVAEYFGISPNTVYLWSLQGKVPSVKLGRLRKFDIMAIDKWIERSSGKAIITQYPVEKTEF